MSTGMIYVDVTYEEWTERHGLEATDMKCNGCGKWFITDCPVICGKYFGLSIPKHSCDTRDYPSCWILGNVNKLFGSKNTRNDDDEDDE